MKYLRCGKCRFFVPTITHLVGNCCVDMETYHANKKACNRFEAAKK